MEVYQGNQVDRKAWMDFYKSNPIATPFQSPTFYDTINSLKGYSASVIAVKKDGIIKALAVVTIQQERGIKSYFSRRAIIYGGILFDNNELDAVILLQDHLIKSLKRKVIFIEIRNLYEISNIVSLFSSNNWEYTPYLNVELTIVDKTIDSLLGGMKYNRRREIRMSLERGAKYKLCTTIKDLRSLYDILDDLYKNRVKLPLPSFDYFKALFVNDFAKIFIVEHDNKIIGGSICPFSKENNTIYTFYYCGLRTYHKEIFPSHLSVLAVIDYAVNNQFEKVDFMGAGIKDKPYSIRDYKLGFGGKLYETGRFLYIVNPFLYNLGKSFLKFIQRN